MEWVPEFSFLRMTHGTFPWDACAGMPNQAATSHVIGEQVLRAKQFFSLNSYVGVDAILIAYSKQTSAPALCRHYSTWQVRMHLRPG